MKSKVLVIAALVLASVSLASAQGLSEGGIHKTGISVSQVEGGVSHNAARASHGENIKQGHSNGSVAAVDLLRGDIRVIQRVLIERGLLHGEADGILGSKTREAISAFQQQQGIQATGSIDVSTISSLGVSDRLSQHAKRSIGRSQSSRTETQTSMSQGQTVADVDLLRDDIRIIQRVLIERGLLHGEADGILGPKTREAISAFQRQQSVQATGSIDISTVSSLGVSDRLSQQAKRSIVQSQPSPTHTQTSVKDQGQAGNGEASTGQPQPEQQNATGHVPDQTTGQATNPPQRRSSTAGQITVSNQSNTTGQALRTQSGIKPTEDQRPLSHAISLTITGAAIGFILLALGAFILMPMV